jgi:hypothetical protein
MGFGISDFGFGIERGGIRHFTANNAKGDKDFLGNNEEQLLDCGFLIWDFGLLAGIGNGRNSRAVAYGRFFAALRTAAIK